MNCPGCFNPETHSFTGGTTVAVSDLLGCILKAQEQHALTGLTVSGGEPLQQGEALIELLEAVRQKSNLNTIVFTGFEDREIEAMPVYERLRSCVDVLISGRYSKSERLGDGLRGSSNKKLHYFSQRLRLQDFESLSTTEVIIDERGGVVVTGIDPVKLR